MANEFIAIGEIENKLVFVEMTRDQVDKCKEINNVKICRHQSVIKREHHKSCLKDLFFSIFENILKTCSIYFQEPTNMATAITHNKFLIFSKRPDTFNLTCNNNTKLAIQIHGQETIDVENHCRALLADFILQPTTELFIAKNLSLRYWAPPIQTIYKNFTNRDLQKLLKQAKQVSGIEKFTPTDLHVAKLLHQSIWESFYYDNPTIISTGIAAVAFIALITITGYLIRKSLRRRKKKQSNETDTYPMIHSRHVKSLDTTDLN